MPRSSFLVLGQERGSDPLSFEGFRVTIAVPVFGRKVCFWDHSMSDWRESTGLADGTDVAKIYVDQDIKEEWKDEAEDLDRSLSQYLFYLVQEARLLREEDLMFTGQEKPDKPEEHNYGEKIEELEDRIQRLEAHIKENNF